VEKRITIGLAWQVEMSDEDDGEVDSIASAGNR